MRMRRLFACLLATGVLAGLAGCSDSSTHGTNERAGTSSPDEANGPAVLTERSFVKEVTAAQSAAGSAHLEATIKSTGAVLDVSGDVATLGDPDAVKMDVLVSFQGQEIRLLRVGEALYLKGGQFAPAGKEWLGIDLSDARNPMAQIFDAVNPGNFTAFLRGMTRFEDAGVETVDGVDTRHYTIAVDTAKMLASNPMFQGQDASTLGLPDELSSEVYVDGENRPVQIEADLGDTGGFEAHFSDYGSDVSVEAPDPSTVGEFSL